LEVVGSGNEQHLEAKKKNWLGRIWMWLGFSNASMKKVMSYLEYQVQEYQVQINSLDFPLDRKCVLRGKIHHYLQRHSYVSDMFKSGFVFIPNIGSVCAHSHMVTPLDKYIQSWPTELNSECKIFEESLNTWVDDKSSIPWILNKKTKHWAQNEEMRAKAAKEIEKAFYNKKSDLDLSNLGLSSLPEVIYQLRNLTSLNLACNKLSNIRTEDFLKFEKLERLDLSKNQLDKLPEDFGKLSNLRHLDLDGNQLEMLPEDFCKLSNLKTLYLEGNRLSKLPKDFDKLSNLEWLHLTSNIFTEIPSEINEMTNLKKLSFGGNKLKEIPTSGLPHITIEF
jgi:hypothetical protein